MIMRRKMLQYLKQQLLRQVKALEKKEEDIYAKIKPLFTEKAYKYLMELRNTKRSVADKIVKYIVLGLYYGAIQYPVDEIVVEYLERKIEGKTGQIYVERRGELKGLDDVLKSDED